MKEDKRRKPYNIWITVLSLAIFLLIGSVGVFIISISLDANVNADGIYTEYDDILDREGEPLKYRILLEEGQSIASNDNWQLSVIKWVVSVLGFIIIIVGIFAGMFYADEHYWKEGYYKLPAKKKK